MIQFLAVPQAVQRHSAIIPQDSPSVTLSLREAARIDPGNEDYPLVSPQKTGARLDPQGAPVSLYSQPR